MVYIIRFTVIMLTDLEHSVISIEGKFMNLYLQEDLVDFYPPEGNILCSESNYGCNIADGYVPVRKSKKPKKKDETKHYKRKKQGNGSQMNSQIQFHVRSHFDEDKIFKIKCFRQQTFGVPGVLKKDLSDVMPSLIDLRDYHRKYNLNEDIEIDDIFPTLVNYKCRIENTDLIIQLKKLVDALELFKIDPTEQDIIFQLLDKSTKISTTMAKAIKSYIPINRFNMAEIKYEQERVSSGITVKFFRPSVRIRKPANLKAKSTIKIFQSGKINLDAVKSQEEAVDLYNWFDNFIQTNYDDIIYDVTVSSSDSSSDSDSD